MQYREATQRPGAGIKVSRSGPYIVSGGIPLARQIIGIDKDGHSCEWREVEKYRTGKTYSLCRCGQSSGKPFCDGTHVEVHFDGTETAGREPYLNQAGRVKGGAIDLTDAKTLCAGARFCDRGGGIWKLTKKSGDPEAKALAEEEAALCPSGRLVVWDKDGHAIEPEFEPSVIVVEDPQEAMQGPLWVRGGIPIESADGHVYEIRNRVTLCRCGKSSNMPFCDASHCQSGEGD